MRAVSVKRQRQMREYRPLRHAYLDGKRCEFPGGCTQPASDVHHRRGRVGGLLLDVRHWSALCRTHHSFVTEHPKTAVEMGISELRIGGGA
jgi:hypothetical protein